MRNYSKLGALIAFVAIVFTSCNKNEIPEITIHELGYNNTRTVVAGTDLHIDAELLAPLKIASIQLIIHSEAEHAAVPTQKVKSAFAETIVWEIDSIYTKGYAGVKNAEFHEHVDVPALTTPGHYHFHLKVTDMDGNQAIKEDEIEVLAAN